MITRTYVLKRILIIIPTVIGVTCIVFAMLRLIPGDPVAIMVGQVATVEEEEILRRNLGLDQPIYVQYFKYLERLVHADWGMSYWTGEDVFRLVLYRFINSLKIVTIGMAISTVFGVITGVLASWYKDTKIDDTLRTSALVTFSAPPFWTGLLLLLMFSYYLRLFPAVGENPILPGFTIAIWTYGITSRITRASMIDRMDEEYVVTARAKGVTERNIMLRHILKNALIPVVTVVSLQFGLLVGGAIVIETVFTYPGLGRLIIVSLLKRDYPMVQGAVIATSTFFILVNLITDIIYSYLDPRVRYE